MSERGLEPLDSVGLGILRDASRRMTAGPLRTAARDSLRLRSPRVQRHLRCAIETLVEQGLRDVHNSDVADTLRTTLVEEA